VPAACGEATTAIDPAGRPLARLGHDPLGRFHQIASTATSRFGYAGQAMIAQRNGSTGSTLAGCSSPSASSRLPQPKTNIMLPSPLWMWQRDPHPTASGKPGAVQPEAGCGS
jgi:hypothetical protein